MKKVFPYIVLVVLLVIWLVVKNCSGSKTETVPSSTNKTNTTASNNKPAAAQRGGLNRNDKLFFTKHARCRMQCRRITQKEVKEILESGTINYNKSELNGTQGPEYAVEGVTSDKQHVRIIFAPKQQHTTVVTVIDLDTDWTCPSC